MGGHRQLIQHRETDLIGSLCHSRYLASAAAVRAPSRRSIHLNSMLGPWQLPWPLSFFAQSQGRSLAFFLLCRSVSETGITQAGADSRRSRRTADLGLDSLIVIISLLPKFCDATIWEGVPAGKVPRPRGRVQVKGTLNLESYDCFMAKDAGRTARSVSEGRPVRRSPDRLESPGDRETGVPVLGVSASSED